MEKQKIPVAGRFMLTQSDHAYGFICQRPEKACANRSIPFLATQLKLNFYKPKLFIFAIIH